MATEFNMTQSAKILADLHRKSDLKISEIYFFPNASDSHICLLEITDSVSVNHNIVPCEFASSVSEKIFFPSIIVLLHPIEFEDIKNNNLQLPPKWILKEAKTI